MEEVMTLEQQEGKKTDRKKKKGCTCCAAGCGLPLLAFVLMISSWLWYVMYYHEFGENKDSFSRVFAPIGVRIKAQTPEEIAVAILAEMISVRRGGAEPKGLHCAQ